MTLELRLLKSWSEIQPKSWLKKTTEVMKCVKPAIEEIRKKCLDPLVN